MEHTAEQRTLDVGVHTNNIEGSGFYNALYRGVM